MYKLAFIGAGSMATAIIRGLLEKQIYKSSEIVCLDPNENTRKKLVKFFRIAATDSYDELKSSIKDDALIVLAIKPQIMPMALKSLGGIKASQVLVSIAAGIKISVLEKSFTQNQIFRVMPNTPAQILKGASAFSYNRLAQETSIKKVSEVFNAVGHCEEVAEKDLDAVTALSGSGPAYVFLMAEAMAKAGEELGLTEATAKALANQTLYGAASLIKESNKEPSELRAQVTSPNGTTQAGIENFQANNFEKIVEQAIKAAYNRSIELGAE